MPHFKFDDPSFWQTSPDSLRYTSVFAEIVGHQVTSFVLGDADDPEAPLAMFVKLPAGWVGVRHSHDCERLEVVIDGSFELSDGTILGPGDVSTSHPGEKYGPMQAGPDGVVTLEIFSRQAGLRADRDVPVPALAKLASMVEALRRGTISPADVAASPAVAEWAQTALAEQPALRAQMRPQRAADAAS